jgi:hypothetical protein
VLWFPFVTRHRRCLSVGTLFPRFPLVDLLKTERKVVLVRLLSSIWDSVGLQLMIQPHHQP